MFTLSADSWSQAQRSLFGSVNARQGVLYDTQFEIINARARVDANRTRATDYGFAAGFFMWNYCALTDMDHLGYYNRRMFNEAPANVARGYFFRQAVEGESQWSHTISELNKNSAALDIVMYGGDGTTIQPTIRDRKLYFRVHQLQCDVVWGLPYDVFNFTMMQEVMMLDLRNSFPDLELGSYRHSVGALWRADRHKQLVEMVAKEQIAPVTMPPIGDIAHLDALIDFEYALRNQRLAEPPVSGGAADWLAGKLVDHRVRRNAELRPHLGPVTA